MTKKITIPVFDPQTLTSDSKIMNIHNHGQSSEFDYLTLRHDYICHDNLFHGDVIEYLPETPNADDIFLIRINNHVYLRKIGIEKNLFRFEPIIKHDKEHTIIVDKQLETIKIYGIFKRKIMVLESINAAK